jgi:tetratricopeptide (TPR) repeat protein
VDRFRQLTVDRADLYESDLIESLRRLASCYEALDRSSDELETVQEMVAISRRRADSGDEKALVELAQCLDTLGTLLSRLGRREEAARALRETLDILGNVTKGRPEMRDRLARLEVLLENR